MLGVAIRGCRKEENAGFSARTVRVSSIQKGEVLASHPSNKRGEKGVSIGFACIAVYLSSFLETLMKAFVVTSVPSAYPPHGDCCVFADMTEVAGAKNPESPHTFESVVCICKHTNES